VAPFVSLPFLARWATLSEWTGLVTGYSVGGMAALIIFLGYPLTGPQQTAAADGTGASKLYFESVLIRRRMLFASIPVIGVLCFPLAPPGQFAGTVGMALSAAVLGLSGSWFSVGLGRPSWLALYDVVPRASGAVLGVCAVALGGGVASYAAVNILSALIGYSLMNSRVRKALPSAQVKHSLKSSLVAVRRRVPAVSTEALTGVYRILPVTLVAIAAPNYVVANYAASDRLFRISLFAIIALGNGLVSWVIRPGEPWLSNRALRALLVHVCLGLVGTFMFVTLGPRFSSAFYGEAYAMSVEEAWLFGLAFLAVSVQTAIMRFYLLARNRILPVFIAAAASAMLAVPAFLLAPQVFGVTGAAAAVLAVETLQVLLLGAGTWTATKLGDRTLRRVVVKRWVFPPQWRQAALEVPSE
jgi:O-antigen/teichoic acid export membrane protein